MSFILGILILSFLFTGVAIVPFINLLYTLKFQRKNRHTKDAFGAITPIFDKFHARKAGKPVGGGLLVIIVVSLLFALILPLMKMFGIEITSVHRNLQANVNILFFTL